MSYERTVASAGGVIFHSIPARENALGKIEIALAKKPMSGEAGYGLITLTDPVGRELTLTVGKEFKGDFIKAVRAALDEWEKI